MSGKRIIHYSKGIKELIRQEIKEGESQGKISRKYGAAVTQFRASADLGRKQL